ncbi:efflux RND transporter periplasmic adaptor subunit [Aureliella helgolandensis]|uniref:Uncharacterized protein n=1 Tax=Aureliella helgolandensis TaxID=2527968 RepID=A0A518G186_9BACT|nr:efflux RND transporter periplasmic adaptor subunit [Aureliella helgolandensis]QDV22365.1 hypothetical protein Q31a_06490 [Aureliella helgolandensis]
MKSMLSQISGKGLQAGIGAAILVLAVFTYPRWWPTASAWIDHTLSSHREAPDESTSPAPSNTTGASAAPVSIELSAQARNNLGLTDAYLRPLEATTYRRSLMVPAVIASRPGRSEILVASPLNGIVTHVHAVTGEAVMPGDLLFEVRLTYEDLVETQTLYLQSLSELIVEEREITRLEEATRSGAISGKSLLDRRYAKEKLEALLRSQREALRLHGLSDRQIDNIGIDGKLMRDLQVVAPNIDEHSEDEELRLSQKPMRQVAFNSGIRMVSRQPVSQHPLIIEDLRVSKGEAVVAGAKLCSLSDYTDLFIEGKAFEQDAEAINHALEQGWTVEGVLQSSNGLQIIGGLKLAFVNNSIDDISRTLSFFVELPNSVVRDETNSAGQRHIAWQYRVGQRLQVRVPVEEWENQIVVPVEAVVQDGADWIVFQRNGKSFRRVPVHVRHRDQTSAVIANDGSIFPGEVIALKAAHQILMAIKNQSGAGADPHAGHSH